MKLLITNLVFLFLISYVVGDGKAETEADKTSIEDHNLNVECKVNSFKKAISAMSFWKKEHKEVGLWKVDELKKSFLELRAMWTEAMEYKLVVQAGNHTASSDNKKEYKEGVKWIYDDWNDKMGKMTEAIMDNPKKFIENHKHEIKRKPEPDQLLPMKNDTAQLIFAGEAGKMHKEVEQIKKRYLYAMYYLKKMSLINGSKAKDSKLIAVVYQLCLKLEKVSNQKIYQIYKLKEECLKKLHKELQKGIDKKKLKSILDEHKKNLSKLVEGMKKDFDKINKEIEKKIEEKVPCKCPKKSH